MRSVIRAERLSKTYKTRVPKGLFRKEVKLVHALRGVDLEIHEGEIFGLLGPNGAGKTTLIKILTTLLIPDEGRAEVLGFDVVKDSMEVRKNIGVMLMGERSLYWKLTGRENLEYFSSLYRIPSKLLKKRVQEVIDFVGLSDFVDRLVETYSSGQKMLLAFAKALINDAPVLFLDEPTVTMDPRNAAMIRSKIRELNHDYGKTILLTTHLMHEAEQLCDRVAIIDKGKILAIGSPDELKSTLRGKSSIEIDIQGNSIEDLLIYLRSLEGVSEVAASYVKVNHADAVRVKLICDSPREILPDVISKIVNDGYNLLYVNPKQPTLEDVFLHYTGRLLTEDTREGL